MSRSYTAPKFEFNLEPGTYECTLLAVKAYENNVWDGEMNAKSEEMQDQLTLVWETDEPSPNGEGNTWIQDAYINLKFGKRAKLVSRLKALHPGYNPEEDEVSFPDLPPAGTALPHIAEGVTETDLLVGGRSVVGTRALVTFEINSRGYPKVTSVVAAPKRKRAPGA